MEQFGLSDGVRMDQFVPGSGLCTPDGRIWLGATDGLLSFHPLRTVSNPTPPALLFTSFIARHPDHTEDVFSSQGFDNLRLSWRTRNIRIGFAALSYWAPEKVHYAYRLDGLDKDWTDIGNRNWLEFNRLSPGHYRLQVRACNNSGVWNNEGITLPFSIRPHPLLSQVAIILYVILAGLLVWLLLRYLVRRMEQRSQDRYQVELESALSHVKEEERDDRYQFISSLADQLEAPVSGIELQLHKLKENKTGTTAIKSELSVIEKNQRMLRGITGNLKKMRTSLSEEGGIAPAPNRDDEFMTALDRLINENLANPELSVAFLAKELAISRSGLFARVKELSGETPNNLINQTRLNAAATLLAEGKYSVGEICYMTGFSSPSYFSKLFASQFGLTPHEWAKKNADSFG